MKPYRLHPQAASSAPSDSVRAASLDPALLHPAYTGLSRRSRGTAPQGALGTGAVDAENGFDGW